MNTLESISRILQTELNTRELQEAIALQGRFALQQGNFEEAIVQYELLLRGISKQKQYEFESLDFVEPSNIPGFLHTMKVLGNPVDLSIDKSIDDSSVTIIPIKLKPFYTKQEFYIIQRLYEISGKPSMEVVILDDRGNEIRTIAIPMPLEDTCSIEYREERDIGAISILLRYDGRIVKSYSLVKY